MLELYRPEGIDGMKLPLTVPLLQRLSQPRPFPLIDDGYNDDVEVWFQPSLYLPLCRNGLVEIEICGIAEVRARLAAASPSSLTKEFEKGKNYGSSAWISGAIGEYVDIRAKSTVKSRRTTSVLGKD